MGEMNMKKALIVISIAVLMVLAVGCGKDESAKMVASDRVYLTLDSNPTTGCTWMVTVQDNGVAEYIGSTYVQDEAPASPSGEQIAGRGGKETLEFKCLKAGDATVVLKYGHAWAADEIYRTLDATIHVNQDLTGTITYTER